MITDTHRKMVTNIQTCAVYVNGFHRKNCYVSIVISLPSFLCSPWFKESESGMNQAKATHISHLDVLAKREWGWKKKKAGLPLWNQNSIAALSTIPYFDITKLYVRNNIWKKWGASHWQQTTGNRHYRLIVLSIYRFSIRNTFSAC